MASNAFKKIMAGLEDASAYVNGDTTRGRMVAKAPKLSDVDVARVRIGLGLSQSEFARGFGISIGTLQGWEQGRRKPPGPARVLLNVITKDPQHVLQAIWPAKKKGINDNARTARRASGTRAAS